MENQGSDSDRSDDGVDTEDQIQGEVYRDQGQFLNNIHKNFLDNVEPIESGLVDVLRAEGVMSSDEEHIIRAGTTRRDTARKMWTLLKRVPPRRFQTSCYPALRAKYPHVLEGKQFQYDGKEKKRCLRHIIMNRTMLNRFGDLFPPFNGCTDEEYSIITEYGELDHRWALAFRLCAKPSNASNADFVQTLQQLLEKMDVTIPENFGEILANGFPCTCKPKPTTTEGSSQAQQETRTGQAYKRHLQVERTFCDQTASKVPWLNAESPYPDTSCGYPSSLDDTDDDRDSVSISSRETTLLTHKQFHEEEDITFETTADKDRFLRELEKVNGALQNTSHIRLLCRQLLDLRDEMKIIVEGTITSESTVSTFSADLRKASSHSRRLVDIIQLLQEKSTEVKKIEEATKDVTWLKSALCSVRNLYLAQRQRLIGEVKEVKAMLKSVQNIYNFCKTQPLNITKRCARNYPEFTRSIVKSLQRRAQSTKVLSKQNKLAFCLKQFQEG